VAEKKKSIGCFGVIGIIFVIGAIGGIVNGLDGSTPEESLSSESAPSETQSVSKNFSSAGCLPVSPSLVSSIAQGFKTEVTIGRAAGFVASDFADVKFVAVEFTPSGSSTKEIAVFGTNDNNLDDGKLDGLIIAADGFAKNFTTWGESTNVDLSIADDGARESIECLSLPGYKIGGIDAEELGFDQAEFLKTAKEKYGVVDENFEDGSTLKVMDLAQSICGGSVSVMKKNLGKDWETSFNKFAIETICPQKLK
jgi:hypothetical protein